MALPDRTIPDFEKITGYDLTTYLTSYVDFISQYRVKIIDYYVGRSQSPNTKAFEMLQYLVDEAVVLDDVLYGARNVLSNGRYWELAETLSDVHTSINTIENSSKWLRSAISKGNFNPQVELERVLRQFQTIEQMSSENGSTNPDFDWLNISLRNDLHEEGYTTAGGNVLNVIGSNRFSIQLRSVVDNISGKKVYGIDLNKKITYENDDLSALGYDDTIKQTVNVLASLRRGQTPEFPEDGIQTSLVAGANRRTVAYPILFRQYYSTFAKDDTLKSLKVTNIETVQDALNISFEIETRLGEVMQEVSQI